MSFRHLQQSGVESGAKIKQNRVVAFLATFCLASLILFYTPAVIFNKNRLFLEGGFFEYVVRSAGVLVLVSLAAFLAFSRLPGRFMRSVAVAISFIALSSCVMSVFVTPVTVDVGLVDGSRQALEINHFLAALEIASLLTLFGVFWLFYDRIASFIRDLLVLFSILLVGYTGYVVARDLPKDDAQTASVGEFMRFSEDDNVLLLLLDTLASDYLLALLEEQPSLAQQLDGFTLFREAASVSPTTYLAMPSIHSGQYIDIGRTLREAYDELVGQQSFLTAAARDGASSYLLNTMFRCPADVVCLKSSEVLSVGREAVTRDWYLLIDIALFRLLPHAFKPLVYNDGDWYLYAARRKAEPTHVNSFRDNRVMRQFARQLRVEGTQPQFKFIHLFNTHYPYNVGRQCEVVAVDNDSLDLALNGARCAIERLVEILEALKQNDIYDSTFIAVFGDHGSHVEYLGPTNADRIDVDASLRFQLRTLAQDRSRDLPRIPKKAHPIYLVKRPGDRGRIELDSMHAVSLIDLPATVCAHSSHCRSEHGTNAYEAPEASSRERLFYDYIWRRGLWGDFEALENEVTEIAIDYPLITGNAYDTVPGDTFAFNRDGFRFRGFGAAEEWGRWSNGPESELKLCFAVPPVSALELVMQTRMFLTDQVQEQRIEIRIDGELAKKETFEYSRADGTDYELRVLLQPHQVDEYGCALISFAFPDAAAPDKGATGDQRLLALGLKSLHFE